MKRHQLKTTALIITAAILVTLATQIYWSIQNYHENRKLLQSELQSILDESVRDYYVNLSKSNFFFSSSDTVDNPFQIIIDSTKDSVQRRSTFKLPEIDSLRQIEIHRAAGIGRLDKLRKWQSDSTLKIEIFRDKKITFDSARLRDLRQFTTSVFLSMQSDSLDLIRLDSLVQQKLDSRSITLDYQLELEDRTPFDPPPPTRKIASEENKLYATSRLLARRKLVSFTYESTYMELIRRSIFSIGVSLLVSAVIIGSLFFLYNIIKRQKQLSEIKNDLINNITHEFKTPIATVMTAIEAIENFDAQKDPERKDRYLTISREQLKKLNLMVEKLLETSTLDSDQIEIQKERIDLIELLRKLQEKFTLLKGHKSLSVSSSENSALFDGDPFHLENAIGNIIDNAIKYGGSSIKIRLKKVDRFHIEISDNGGNLSNADKNLIFDKFYRVPQGNVHDVKGFGIGLYYAKKVIEKHGGSIQVQAIDRETVFKIIL